MSARQHPFNKWLDEQRNDVYRAFLRDYRDRFPIGGSRADLRAVVEADNRELAPGEWHPLDLFDAAWQQYRNRCAAPDCKQHVGLRTDWCADHDAEVLL